MGRPKKNQSNAADQNQTADNAAAIADAPATATITMAHFMSLPNRADYKSIHDAAQRVYGDAYEAKHDQNLRNAAKKHDAFKAPGALVAVEVEGYSIPPLTYLRVDAIDAYADAQRNGTANVGRMRGGKKRHIVRLSPEDLIAYNAGTLALTVDLFPLEVASTPKPTKAEKEAAAKLAAENAASADQTADQTDAEQPPAADAADQTGGDEDDSAARF